MSKEIKVFKILMEIIKVITLIIKTETNHHVLYANRKDTGQETVHKKGKILD